MYVNPKGKGKHNILKVGDTFKNTDEQLSNLYLALTGKSL